MNRTYLVSIAEIIGVLISVLPLIIPISNGEELIDVFFDKAFATLYIALDLRMYNIFTAIFSIITLAILILLLQKKGNKFTSRIRSWLRLASGLLMGYVLIELLLFNLLDALFYRNAFVSIPFMIGILLLIATNLQLYTDQDVIEMFGQVIFKKQRQFFSIYKFLRLIKYLVIFILAISLIFSNLQFIGFSPEPPTSPAGYPHDIGSSSRPYEVSRIRISYDLPDHIEQYISPINDSGEFYSYMYVPNLINEPTIKIPVVLMLHGFGSHDLDLFYDHIMRLMASRGAIAIFTQYPLNIDLIGPYEVPDNATDTYHPSFYLRYTTLWEGIKTSIAALQGNNSLLPQDLTEYIGVSSIDLSNMLVTGHSYGGGATPYIASKILEMGWASSQLIINQEAPFHTGTWPGIETNFSVFESSTIVNVNTYIDDFNFPMCVTMEEYELWYQNLTINKENLHFTIIQSDSYGFPHLVATHYTPSDPTMDALGDYGVFRRVDAMVAYLLANANGDEATKDDVLPYFTGDAMLDMGVWSDGTLVNPMLYSQDPLGIRSGPNIADNFSYLSAESCE